MPDDGTLYLAELMSVMLKHRYSDKVHEYETTTVDTDSMNAEIDEAKDAAIWTLTALAALGYTLRRTGAILTDQLNN